MKSSSVDLLWAAVPPSGCILLDIELHSRLKSLQELVHHVTRTSGRFRLCYPEHKAPHLADIFCDSAILGQVLVLLPVLQRKQWGVNTPL